MQIYVGVEIRGVNLNPEQISFVLNSEPRRLYDHSGVLCWEAGRLLDCHDDAVSAVLEASLLLFNDGDRNRIVRSGEDSWCVVLRIYKHGSEASIPISTRIIDLLLRGGTTLRIDFGREFGPDDPHWFAGD